MASKSIEPPLAFKGPKAGESIAAHNFGFFYHEVAFLVDSGAKSGAVDTGYRSTFEEMGQCPHGSAAFGRICREAISEI